MSVTAPAASPLPPDVQAGAFNSLSSSSLSLAIWFDDRIFERAKEIARYLAAADGFTPPHLIGKKEACFAVVERSLTWKMSPYAVAQSTYQTPGGKVGFEGKLCQAILENSGRIEGGVQFEYFYNVDVEWTAAGRKEKQTFSTRDEEFRILMEDHAAGARIVAKRDWTLIQGKFRKAKSDRGKEFAVPAWNPEHEAGLGVMVRAQVKGEAKPRELPVLLIQAFPRNSTLWATDPMTQLGYLAVRRFANSAAPGIFLGLPFDREDEDAAMMARDVNPRPARADFAPDTAPTIEDASVVTEVTEPSPEDEAAADRMAQQFAETGRHHVEEETEQDDAEIDADEAETNRDEGLIEVETARPHAEYWTGDSYAIPVPTTSKGSPHFTNWADLMRRAAMDARTLDELRKLDLDNGKSWQSYQIKLPDAYKELRQDFATRATQLQGK